MQAITWGELITGVSVALVGYYGIWFIKYRASLRNGQALPPAAVWSRQSVQVPASADPLPEKPTAKESSVYSAVSDLLEELKPVFAAAVKESLNEKQILEAIGHRFQKYAAIKESSFEPAVNAHVVMELQQFGFKTISHENIQRLWQG